MIKRQNSRRNFLGSIAILSVGTAFSPITQSFFETESHDDMKAQWKRFCLQHKGRIALLQRKTETPQPTTGHWHEDGALVIFPQHDLLARPTWIYWSEKKDRPADVIITFYHNDGSFKKQFRINRFEWEAFLSLSSANEKRDVIVLMKEVATKRSPGTQINPQSYLKVAVSRKGNMQVRGRLLKEEISINKEFTLSV